MNDALQRKIERFTALKAQMPSSELPRWTLAQSYEEAGLLEKARQEYAELVTLKPDYCLAWLRLGALSLTGHPEEARKAILEGRRLAIEQGHSAPKQEADSLLRQLNDEDEDEDEDWPSL